MLMFFFINRRGHRGHRGGEEIARRVNLTSKVLPVLDRISCRVDRPQYFGRGRFTGFLAYITTWGCTRPDKNYDYFTGLYYEPIIFFTPLPLTRGMRWGQSILDFRF
jgi:hypothetical protein